MQQELCHAESCSVQHLNQSLLFGKAVLTIPDERTQTDPDFHAAMYWMITAIERAWDCMLDVIMDRCSKLVPNRERAIYLFIGLRETRQADTIGYNENRLEAYAYPACLS